MMALQRQQLTGARNRSHSAAPEAAKTGNKSTAKTSFDRSAKTSSDKAGKTSSGAAAKDGAKKVTIGPLVKALRAADAQK